MLAHFDVLTHVLNLPRSTPKIAESDLTHLGVLAFEKVGGIPLIRSRMSIAAICLIGAAASLLQDLACPPARSLRHSRVARRVISA